MLMLLLLLLLMMMMMMMMMMMVMMMLPVLPHRGGTTGREEAADCLQRRITAGGHERAGSARAPVAAARTLRCCTRSRSLKRVGVKKVCETRWVGDK